MLKIWFAPALRGSYLLETSGELSALQKLVGGYIELHSLGGGLMLVCNEVGQLKGLPFNQCVRLPHGFVNIVGDFFVTRVNLEGDFVDLRRSDIEKLKKIFPY